MIVYSFLFLIISFLFSFYQNFYINFFVEFWRDFIWFILNEIKDKKLNINEYDNKMNWISFQTSILSIHFATINHLYLSHQLNLSFCFISFQLDKWNDSVCDAELINTVISEIETFSLTQSFLNVNQHRLNQSQIIFLLFLYLFFFVNKLIKKWLKKTQIRFENINLIHQNKMKQKRYCWEK